MVKYAAKKTTDIQDLYASDTEEGRREKFANERNEVSKSKHKKIPENLGRFFYFANLER